MYARRQKEWKGDASGTRLPLDWGERKINGGNCELSGDHHIFLITFNSRIFPFSEFSNGFFFLLLTRKWTAVYFDPHANSPWVLAVGDKPHFAGNEGQIQHLVLGNVRVHVSAKQLKQKSPVRLIDFFVSLLEV